MSTGNISGHIPDLDLITFYSENNRTLFARISPWSKAAMLVVIVLFLTLIQSLPLLVGLYLAVLAVYALAKLPVRKLFAWYLLPIIFVFSLVVFMMWEMPGTALISWDVLGETIALTDNGLLFGVRLLVKALISVTFSLFFLMTTKYNHFSTMIYRVFPYPIDQIFLMSYRFIFVTLKMVDAMIKSLRSRGSGLIASVLKQSRLFGGVFALVFIRSYDKADRITKAMEARGFSGKYIATTKVPPVGLIDGSFILISLIVTIFMAWKGW